MSRFFVDPESRQQVTAIEQLIEQNGWDVTRQSVTDGAMKDGKKHIRTTLILERPVDE